MTHRLDWGSDDLRLSFVWHDELSPRLAEVRSGAVALASEHPVPFIELATVAAGHRPASSRLAHSQLGERMRYLSHVATATTLDITTCGGGLEVVAHLRRTDGVGAVTSWVTVRNTGAPADRPQVLRSVASWSAALGAGVESWTLVRGASDWLAEGRWQETPLRASVPALRSDLTGQDPRGSLQARSHGTWSTGTDLPVGALVSPDGAWAWQIEHNGAWRWEVGEELTGASLTLAGPTDDDHAWSTVLHAGETFSSVPVTVALGRDLVGAVAALTDHRRANRRAHTDNTAMPVVFNDYMNTLNGDPTTDRLLPLIDAAADAGAEIFCIDAGWYDDSIIPGAWWGSVGEWLPSPARFPNGLSEVIDRIRERGMVAGLWLEPEVVGVRSAMADRLPNEAFLQRSGVRVEEHERYHLDLRHPAAIAHLDSVVDGLVAEFGIGFFKFDYNINPGSGTDARGGGTSTAPTSPGAGLLDHNRAHLAWIDALLDRHPELVIENCSSGAMRADYAMLSRLQMQSTSDQQDFELYPPIAASAPLLMLPEQAANWAYPQPSMSDEEIVFCLVTGLLGRFYLSGYLNTMTDAQRALVREAVAAAKELRPAIRSSAPSWPLGLPGWTDHAVALALTSDAAPDAAADGAADAAAGGAADARGTHVSVWNRTGTAPIRLELPSLVGTDVDVVTVFPTTLAPWPAEWDANAGVLTVHPLGDGPAARLLRLNRRTV